MSAETIRPLWWLLLKARSGGSDVELNCDDCFLILEYLADMQQNLSADFEFIRDLARKHLTCCPDCHGLYQKRLRQLEQIQ